MKIEWRRIPQGGKDIVTAFIDTGDLDLGIDIYKLPLEEDPDGNVPMTTGAWIPPAESTEVVLEIPDDPENRDDEQDDEDADEVEDDALGYETSQSIEVIAQRSNMIDGFNLERLMFRIDTYQALTGSPEEVWDALLMGPNLFLQTLTVDEQRQLCLYFIETRRIIDRDLFGSAITDVATDLGNALFDLAVQIDLPNKLLNFITYHSNIPIPPSLEHAGKNVGRDSEEMTFREPEYRVLLAISVLCKMLFPIWGDLIERTRRGVDNMLKETQCINLIEPVLTLEPFNAVRNKLYYYVTRIVEGEMKNHYPTASFAATIGGVSKEKFPMIIFSNLVVKRFVTIDLYTATGNFMVWISACSKQAYRSQQQTLNKHCRIMPRTDVSDTPDGDEERSISVLEHASRTSDVTADVPQLIRFGVLVALPKLMKEFGIADLEFRQVMNHYQQNPIEVSIFNKILVGMFVGEQIGGAQGLKYLDRPLFMQLVAIVQIHIAKTLAVPFVAHLLSATTPDEEKPVLELSSINGMIITSFKNTSEYRQCELSFPYAINNMGVAVVLKRLLEHITQYHHYANTAPFLTALMDGEPLPNNTLLLYGPDIMQQTCEVILDSISMRVQSKSGIRVPT
jgi:hypothetical protein